MARLSAAAAMVRAPSVDSSAPSTIQVASADALDEDSSSERVPASTPPTSLAETNSNAGSVKGANVPSQLSTIMTGAEEEQTGGRRTRRARASVNYNLVELSNAQVIESKRFRAHRTHSCRRFWGVWTAQCRRRLRRQGREGYEHGLGDPDP
jgi:hypothetical protein